MGASFGKTRWRRRLARMLAACCALLLLTGCDPLYSKKPFSFPYTVWVCKERPACIAVSTQGSFAYGEFLVDGTVVPVTLCNQNGPAGSLRDFTKAYSSDTIYTPLYDPDPYYWSGDIDYTPKKFTLTATDTYRDFPLLSDEDLPLTFLRVDVAASDLLPLMPWEYMGGDLYLDPPPGKLARLFGAQPDAPGTEYCRVKEDFVPGALLAWAEPLTQPAVERDRCNQSLLMLVQKLLGIPFGQWQAIIENGV